MLVFVFFLFFSIDNTTRPHRRTVHIVEPIAVPGVDLEAGRGLVVGGWGPGQLQPLQGKVVEERARVFHCSGSCVCVCVRGHGFGCRDGRIRIVSHLCIYLPCSPLAMCRRVISKSVLLFSILGGRVFP